MGAGADESGFERRISLRTRLTVWVVAVFMLIQLVISGGFWLYQRTAMRDLFERQLLERAQSMAQEVRARLPLLTRQELTAIAQQELGYVQFERFDVDVVDGVGRSLVSSGARWPELARGIGAEAIRSGKAQRSTMRAPLEWFETGAHEAVEAIALRMHVEQVGGAALIVVTSDAFVAQQQVLVTRILVVGGMIGLIASAMSGWFIAGIAVTPIRRLSNVAEQLRPETIDRELVVDSRNAEIAELTRELDAARARIRAAFAAQERFLSNISHELKTPIATLLLESQTLDRAGFPAAAVEFVETTEDEMRKLGQLVESFLMLTRVREGSGLARLRSYPANELVMDAVVDCASMSELYSIHLEPTLVSEEAGGDVCVLGDPDLLRTMLNNLIRNAIRFTPRGGRVLVVASASGSQYRIAVRDGGPGIAPEMLPRVFDRHSRGAEDVRRERGYGLGLAIAKGIAELHGGDIAVRNLPGGGAEFAVEMPARVESAAEQRGSSVRDGGDARRDGKEAPSASRGGDDGGRV